MVHAADVDVATLAVPDSGTRTRSMATFVVNDGEIFLYGRRCRQGVER